MQLSDYNFGSVAFEKSASSLPLRNLNEIRNQAFKIRIQAFKIQIQAFKIRMQAFKI